MPDETFAQELQRILADAGQLSEENQRIMTDLVAEIGDTFARIAADPKVSPATLAQGREMLRAGWLLVLDSCLAEEDGQSALLHSLATRSEANHNLMIELLRNAKAIRTMLDGGNYTGTWEQREALMDDVHQIEAMKESLLNELPVGEIQKLRDEGLL